MKVHNISYIDKNINVYFNSKSIQSLTMPAFEYHRINNTPLPVITIKCWVRSVYSTESPFLSFIAILKLDIAQVLNNHKCTIKIYSLINLTTKGCNTFDAFC